MKRSILINNHNNAPFLKACLDSVISQVESGDEVIVYDDGSTDGSAEVLAGYGTKIRTILAKKLTLPYRQCQMEGISASFSKSTGQLIFLLDGDDTFLPNKLTAYTAAFQDPEVSMVQGPMLLIDGKDEVFGRKQHSWAHGVDTSAQILRTNDLDYFYPTSALAFRRETFSTCLPLKLDSVISPDIALSVIGVLLGKVVTLDEPFTAWRQHRSNHSSRFSKPFHRLQFDLQIANMYNQWAKRFGRKPRISAWKNPRMYRRAVRHIIGDLLGIGRKTG